MIGKTNSQTGGAIKGEKLNISLVTNQTSHSDLLGAIITVTHPGGTSQHVWEGSEITVDIPPYVDYSVEYSEVEGYATPAKFESTAVAENYRTITGTYNTTVITASIGSNQSDKTDVANATVSIGGKTLKNGESAKFATGSSLTATFSTVTGYATPASQSITASGAAMTVTGTYNSTFVTVAMSDNQTSLNDIASATATVAASGITTQTVSNGGVVKVPTGVSCTVTWNALTDYKTPTAQTFTTSGTAVTKTGLYQTEIVSVTLSADDGSSVNGAKVNINGNSQTWNGTALTQKVAFGTAYTVSVGDMDGFVTPDSQSYTASQSSRNLAFTYKASTLTVNILSNQESDDTISAVKATVAYGSTTLQVGNGETVGIPYGKEITITFPNIQGYKTPDPIVFVSSSFSEEKSATYNTQILMVDVLSSGDMPIGYEAEIKIGTQSNSAYKSLEYVESTGEQYIDTGFTPDSNSRVDILISPTSVDNAGANVGSIPYGSAWGAGNSAFECYTWNGQYEFNYGNNYSFIQNLVVGNKYFFSHNKSVVTGVDITNKTQSSISLVENEFTSPFEMILFGSRRSSLLLGKQRIYACQIFDNGILVRDYVPAMTNEGVVGMYDKVHRTFCSSATSVSLVAGPENGTIVDGIHIQRATRSSYKIPYGENYSVSANDVEGFVTPQSQSGTANSESGYIGMTYISSSLKINILSNQESDATIAAVKATVTYGSTSVEVSNGETISVPSNTEVTITFPEVDGYKTPETITFTHTGGQAEKTGTYQCELLTVNVSSDNGSVSGYEVTISKQETVGVATKYTKLEYIEANGAQYANTGFVPNINTSFVAELSIPSGIGNKNLFCAYTNFVLNSKSDTQLEWKIGSSSWTHITTPSAVTSKFKVEYSAKSIKFNDEEIDTPNITSLSNTYPLWLFYRDSGSSSYLGYGKLYSLKIYDNGTLVRDYIPALRSDGIAGLYDAVNDNFIASLGSSNFIAGTESSETIATQTTVTGTYKIPFDASYIVQASSVSGYTTPASVTRVASEKSYTIAQEYAVISTIDLSLYDVYGNAINRSTANCYVVREAGDYKFPLVYGNGIKNGKVNTAAFTNNGNSYSHDFVDSYGNVITSPYIPEEYGGTAEVANMDTEGLITVNTYPVKENDGIRYIHFTVESVPNSGANAIIQLISPSTLWSWHIWLWPHDLSPVEITNSTGVTYNIMPVNLASKYDSDGTHIKNWFYQWGRKDPMLLPSAYNSTTDHSPGSITKTSKADAINDGIQNPTEFYYNSSSPYNWFGSKSYYNLWDAACTGTGNSDNDTVKTVYDPCPVGWKIPNGNTFTGLSIISSANGIVKMARYSGDTVGVDFPLSGCRDSSDGSLYDVGSYGYVWLSSAYSQYYAYRLYFRSGFVYPQDYFRRASGYSVRPVEDDNIQLDVIMISFTIAGTTYQAESGMTWFEWVNSEYNTGGYIIKNNYITTADMSNGDFDNWYVVASAYYYYDVFSTTNIVGGTNYVHSGTVTP